MTQLDKSKNEIAKATVDELYPLIPDSPTSMYKHRECTWERPMNLILANGYGKWQHPEEAVHEIDCGSDYYARYQCKACGHKWESELPE